MLEPGETAPGLLGEPAKPAELFGERDEPDAGPDKGAVLTGEGDGELLGAVAVTTLMLTFCPAEQWPVIAQM